MNSAAAATSPARPASGRSPSYAPILRASHDQIRELGARRSTSLSHIQSAVEGDPAVALNLFARVNAKLKRAGHAPVGDIPRAILFTGMAELPGQMTQSAVLEDTVAPALQANLSTILRRAHHAARQARAIGTLAGGLNGEELLAASLTREGLPYVELLANESDVKLEPAMFSDSLPTVDGGHDATTLSTTCLDLAARFAEATELNWDEEALDELYGEIGHLTGRSTDEISKRLRLATVEAARAGSHFAAYPAATHLMSPGTAPKRPPQPATSPSPTDPERPPKRRKSRPANVQPPERQTEDAAHTRDAADVRPARTKPAAGRAAIAAAEPPPPANAPAPHPDIATGLDELARSAAGGQSGAALLPLALQLICDHCDMKLALLLMKDKSSGHLALRAHRGLEVPEKYTRVPVPLEENPLLSRLMGKAAGFQWGPEKHGKTLKGLPLKLMGGKDAFFYSLHVDDKPLGILVGCRPAGDSAAIESSFERFKKIGGATRDALRESRRSRKR